MSNLLALHRLVFMGLFSILFSFSLHSAYCIKEVNDDPDQGQDGVYSVFTDTGIEIDIFKKNLPDLAPMKNAKPLSWAVIGAGPVGLLTVIELISAGYKDITLVEKRRNYTRNQVILALNFIFDLYRIFGKNNGDNIDNRIGIKDIKIKDLEQLLMVAAQEFARKSDAKLDVKLGYEFSNTDCNLPTDIFLNQDIVVGADGFNSRVRKILPDSDLKLEKKLGYLASFVLRDDDNSLAALAKKLGQFNGLYIYSAYKATQVVIRIDESKFNELKVMTESGQRQWAIDYLKKSTHPSFEGIELNIYDGNQNMQVFPLNTWSSGKFAAVLNNQTVFLVGDAAKTEDFIRFVGISDGLKNAKSLIRLISEKNSLDEAATFYNWAIKYGI